MSGQYGGETLPGAGANLHPPHHTLLHHPHLPHHPQLCTEEDFCKDSFSFGVDEDEEDEDEEDMARALDTDKPRILLMGLRRSGKSSIQKVVFHKMSPSETLFLESTNKIYKDDISSSSFVQFQIWDFPGQVDFFDPTFDYEMIFRGTGALIFVIDAQDDYMEALGRLHLTVSRAYRVNPHINFEVFVHKVDGLSDDHKIETQRDVHQRANDDLTDAGLDQLHLRLKEDGSGSAYDKDSLAIIKLNNTTVLYLKEVTKFLTLVLWAELCSGVPAHGVLSILQRAECCSPQRRARDRAPSSLQRKTGCV
ncbi:hypothetical protein HF521_001760 [Silurus meridionalis]|uniref:Ras-related GTP-binding protein n=1 Tax=Silurus meridionalis TaxID=175797 RepID=A0A8T0B8E2_SILME|nr:hypothetical protein HF521_001760 [Silurus meridionalis]